MKRTWFYFSVSILILIALGLAARPSGSVQALPEYSAQVGEPCSSCHVSPSGGGSRNPRGQAWVGEGKPGTVPDLVAALEILGVHLEVDEADYSVVAESVQEADPLQVETVGSGELHDWLVGYEGN